MKRVGGAVRVKNVEGCDRVKKIENHCSRHWHCCVQTFSNFEGGRVDCVNFFLNSGWTLRNFYPGEYLHVF